GGVARAGVSAFGFGGTNAHVIVEEWPAGRPSARGVDRPEVFAVWGADEQRLRDRARGLADWLPENEPGLAELAAALVHGCDSGAAGAVLVAGDRDQLRERLCALAEGRPDPSVLPSTSEASSPVFVFSGYGSYWPGMGRRLLAHEPAFRAAVEGLDPDFRARIGVTLTTLLTEDSEDLALRQPATFGMQVALAALWRAYGVLPAAVIGHSVGEVAAAVVSGALSPADGLRVVVARASLLSRIDASGTGAMAVVELPAGEIVRLAGRFPGIGVAVHASPRHSTVSGPAASVDGLVSHVADQGGLARRLRVGGAGHSPAVDPILAPLRERLAGLEAAEPAVPSYSTVDERRPIGAGVDYWVANVRQPVRFAQAITAALTDGHRDFIEIAPHPIAAVSVEQTATALCMTDVRMTATLRRDPDGTLDGFAAALAGRQHDVLRVRYPQRAVVDLPGPAWRRRRHWTAARPPAARSLLGTRIDLPEPGRYVWYSEIDSAQGHTTFGLPVFPAGGIVELAMAAARSVLGGAELTDAQVVAPLVLSATTEVCVSAYHRTGGLDLSVYARSASRPEWTLHALAVAEPGGGSPAELPDVPVRRSDLVAPPEMLCYQPVWQEEPLPSVPREPRRVVLLHEDAERAERVAALLSGDDVQVLPLGTSPPPADVVVVLVPARDVVLAVADLVRVLADGPPARLWLVTQAAAAVVPGERGDPGPAALRGLVRVLAFEHPELHAGWLDTDADDALVAEVRAGTPEDEVAWRAGRRYVHRVTPLSPAPDPTAPVVRPGAYVITGGTGGLGRVAAQWLAERGATRVVLSGRRPRSVELSCDVRVVTGDIAEPGVAERLVAAATEGGLPLRGVVHAAGALSDASVLAMDKAGMMAAWHAKVVGAQRLWAVCEDRALDWWVAYSSAAGLFGSPGQAAYATANAWLDAFCEQLRAQGVPATSVQWGAWDEVGGATEKDNAVLDRLSPAEAMPALRAILGSDLPQAAVVRFDPARIVELFPALARRPFIGALLPEPTGETTWSGVAELAAQSDPDAVRAAVTAHMRATVAEMMRTAPDRLDVTAPLTSLGLDSLLAMRARAAIERDFGLHLPLPLLLRGASLDDLARHVAGELATNNAPVPAKPAGPGTRDFAERWVARMWREVLDEDVVSVHIPFEGAAERLRARIACELGAAMPQVDLFAQPTIAGMADLLRPVLEEHGGGAVRVLSDRGDTDPLFLFHPAGGSTAVYGPLVKLLGDDVPCLGLERLPDLATVEEKAARYAELIRERQPEGPYRLGGWSFGGCLAYETARQLGSDQVGLLFLGDTILPLDTPRSEDYLTGRFRRFVQYVERTYQVDLDLSTMEHLAEDERFPLVIERLRERVPGMGEAVLHHQYTSYVDAQVAEQYRPGPYEGKVLLFRAEQPHPLTTELDPRYLRADRALGWDAYCPHLEVLDVPGDHISMVDPPNIDVLAERVSATLEALS
ncbi:SDR family NAD(P)-dependent oxidoreductase, partial [Actinophytocola sp.]|uniref:SDR family NAD(P)-dependent oxidoreductase n=1 Tax=Actinophytocola sp. TaxID=1872138 RepID=UPI002ECFDC11